MLLRRRLLSVTAALVLTVSSARGEEPMPEPEPESGCFDEQGGAPRPCPDFFERYLERKDAAQPAIGDLIKAEESRNGAGGIGGETQPDETKSEEVPSR
jgi:hypothetical protein